MSTDNDIKKIVFYNLSRNKPSELWSVVNNSVLPITPQEFSIGAVLPAILYMMRWGYRRGKGKFINTFGDPTATKTKEKAANVSNVSERLVKDNDSFIGFDGEVEKNILSDLFLTYCFENTSHSSGRKKTIQRAFPNHYFSSWIDLPEKVSHLRYVPEMILTILVDKYGDGNLDFAKGKYPINSDFENNFLLKIFGKGTEIRGEKNNKTSDRFVEETNVSIDQLLAIRIAQKLGEPPIKISSSKEDSAELRKFLPISQLAYSNFSNDFNIFLRAYNENIPRQSLLPMLESCMSIGLTNIFLSTLTIMLNWKKTGEILDKSEQKSYPLFVDCSMSMNHELRRTSEEYFDNLLRELEFLPICSMCIRVLDIWVKMEEDIEDYPNKFTPYPLEKLNFLGSILKEVHEESKTILKDIRRSCQSLAKDLEGLEEGDVSDVISLLENKSISPAWRLSEAIVILMKDKLQISQFRKFLDSCLMVDNPSGICRKRRVTLKGKAVDRRSIILTNTALDFLVHRYLRQDKKGTPEKSLSLNKFIEILKTDYGFYINESPPGISISNDLLEKNRSFLEKRLRDLGLLIGVNDAESMKKLRSRF